MEEFLEIQRQYETLREAEREKIRDCLIAAKFEGVSMRSNAGKGRADYTSGKRLKYDLTNWKYVEAVKDEVHFLISLQPFETDPNSHNRHVLKDRIGIYAYMGEYSSEEAFNHMKITELELPMDEKTLSELVDILNEWVPCFKQLNAFYKRHNMV